MKKYLLACLLLSGLSVAAQRMPREGHGRQHMQEFSAEEMATLQSKQMTLALDLTATQEQQVKKLLTGRIEERRVAREARQKDSAAKAGPKMHYEHMNGQLDSEIAFRRELKKILSEPQYEQWRQMHGSKGLGRHMGPRHRKG